MGVFHSFKSVLAQLQQWGKVKEVCITQMLDPTDVDVQVKSKGSSRGELSDCSWTITLSEARHHSGAAQAGEVPDVTEL